MRAVSFAEYGGPSVLTVVETAVPVPEPGQVRVAVRAAGVNPIDVKLRSGAMSAGKPLPRPRRLGAEDQTAQVLRTLLDAAVLGRITSPATRRMGLAQAAEAHRELEEKGSGKIVLVP